MTNKPSVKPQSSSVTNLLMTVLFVVIWLALQLGFHRFISRVDLVGMEQVGLRIFQIVAGLVTLMPIIGYFFIDRRIAALSNPILREKLGLTTERGRLKSYWPRLFVFGLLGLTLTIYLGGFLLARQYSGLVVGTIFLAGLISLMVAVGFVMLRLLGGRFNDRLPNLRHLDLSRNQALSGIDLSGKDLKQANLAGANLSQAILSEVNLERADLSQATLTEANLTAACLVGADLREAHLNKARLIRANLRGASLVGAKLEEAILEKAFLDGADLRQAYLEQAKLPGAALNKAQCDGAYLIEAKLSKATLIGAGMSQSWLADADLSQALLIGAVLQEANLNDCNLAEADLEGTNLRQASLVRANLTEASLVEADLAGTLLIGAVLTRANLSQADLSGADLSEAHLQGAILNQANLKGANISDASFDEDSNLNLIWKIVNRGTPDRDLSQQNLSQANLSDAFLWKANLTKANLSDTNLSQADLMESNLVKANLCRTNLRRANLSQADLTEANLTETNLSEANLTGAKLRNVNLNGANLARARLIDADLNHTDLRKIKLTENLIQSRIQQKNRVQDLALEQFDLMALVEALRGELENIKVKIDTLEFLQKTITDIEDFSKIVAKVEGLWRDEGQSDTELAAIEGIEALHEALKFVKDIYNQLKTSFDEGAMWNAWQWGIKTSRSQTNLKNIDLRPLDMLLNKFGGAARLPEELDEFTLKDSEAIENSSQLLAGINALQLSYKILTVIRFQLTSTIEQAFQFYTTSLKDTIRHA